MEYYLTLKRSEGLIHGTTWMNLENMMLSFQNKEINRDRIQICGFQGLRGGKDLERNAYGVQGFLLG